MRLCRFDHRRFGVVEGDQVIEVTDVLTGLASPSYPLPGHDPMIANLETLRPTLEGAAKSGSKRPLDGLRLDSPVANPGKIMAAPVNYRKHLEEVLSDAEIHHRNQAHMRKIQEVGLFLKANSALTGPGHAIPLRHLDRRNDHEIELAVIIGRTANHVTEAAAMDIIAGYAIGLDMTVRGPEERSLRKSIDGYAVLGPWLVTADEIANPHNLDFELSVNGEIRQKANTRDMVMDIPALIAFASRFYTLHPGDILMTGTPEGVGPVQPGDSIRAWFQSIGEMTVAVAAEA